MRILVTGAAGFLGTNLCEALEKSHCIVRGTRQTCDVTDLGRIEEVLADHEIEAVIHLAARTEVGASVLDPISTFDTNIRGTWNVLEACRKQKVKRVILASSDKVYGLFDPPYIEDMIPCAQAPYESSKVCLEAIAASYICTYKMSVAITRCTNLYGPGHMNMTALIPYTIQCALKGRRPVLRSDGTMKRDFLHVEDAVRGYRALLESDYCGPMNFGTGKPQRVIDVVDLILGKINPELRPDIQATAKHEIQDQWVDPSLVEAKLKWKARLSFDEGIDRTIEWHRKENP